MKIYLFAIIISSLFLLPCLTNAQKELDNIFYCQNTMWEFENKPQTPQQKAELLKKVGFDGLEGFGHKDFFELQAALKKEGLSMPVNYVELNFNEDDATLKGNSSQEIKEMIRSTDKGAIIYFILKNEHFMNNKELGDKMLVPKLRELADYAAGFDVKLCVYPHVGYYNETLAHAVKLAKLVDRKNYGATLNLCHLLKVEGSEGIAEKIENSISYLFAVNICGADDGETKQFGWDRLIQPLGQGTFDTYEFVKLLVDSGYKGPFGIQCYSLKGDAATVLIQTVKVWEEYKIRYAQEK